jgi:hypothetical protein
VSTASTALKDSIIASIDPAIEERLPEPPRPVAAMRAATISTLDGTVITHGVAELSGTSDDWMATVGHLDQPGQVATAFFAHYVREVVLSLNDGRGARARLVGTSFSPGAERTCDLRGLEPLSRPQVA